MLTQPVTTNVLAGESSQFTGTLPVYRRNQYTGDVLAEAALPLGEHDARAKRPRPPGEGGGLTGGAAGGHFFNAFVSL